MCYEMEDKLTMAAENMNWWKQACISAELAPDEFIQSSSYCDKIVYDAGSSSENLSAHLASAVMSLKKAMEYVEILDNMENCAFSQFGLIPNELILKIFGYLGKVDLKSVSMCCKRFSFVRALMYGPQKPPVTISAERLFSQTIKDLIAREITTLNVTRPGFVRDDDFSRICRISTLESLTIQYTGISASVFTRLSALPNLINLDLGLVAIEPDLLVSTLTKLTKLKILRLPNCVWNISVARKVLPWIEKLDFGYSVGFDVS